MQSAVWDANLKVNMYWRACQVTHIGMLQCCDDIIGLTFDGIKMVIIDGCIYI